jgi:hypothetical protein
VKLKATAFGLRRLELDRPFDRDDVPGDGGSEHLLDVDEVLVRIDRPGDPKADAGA